MDEKKQSATEDLAIAVGAGLGLAGQVFMWILAMPWLLIGVAVILNRSGYMDLVGGGLLIGAGLFACPPAVKWMMEEEVKRGRKPQQPVFFIAMYLVFAVIGLTVVAR